VVCAARATVPAHVRRCADMTLPGQFDEKDHAELIDGRANIKKHWWVLPDWLVVLGFAVAVADGSSSRAASLPALWLRLGPATVRHRCLKAGRLRRLHTRLPSGPRRRSATGKRVARTLNGERRLSSLGGEPLHSLVNKAGAAEHFLNEAMTALLDRDDRLTAIVLAGAAEDVYQGLLKLSDRSSEAARAMLVAALRDFVALEDPGAPPMADGEGHSAMRGTYNWLRHHDGTVEEPMDRRLDYRLEAAAVIERAVVNQFAVSSVEHLRFQELLMAFRGYKSPNR
jgi:hypothetical protein